MQLNVIDLFCGVGGLGLGAARAGFELSLSVDNDVIALETHRRNFPNNRHLNHDIAALSGKTLMSEAGLQDGELTGLIGGPPCQGFSRIGKRDLSDSRNLLFGHFCRLVSETRPLFFLAENVQGILDEPYKEIIDEGISAIPADYTVLEPFCLNAADYGAATSRERVIFFGYLPSKIPAVTRRDFTRIAGRKRTSVATALTGLPIRLKPTWITDDKGWRKLRKRPLGAFWSRIYGEIPSGVGDPATVGKLLNHRIVSGCIATEHTEDVIRRFNLVPEGQVDSVSRAPRLHRDRLCPTLRAGTGSDRGSFQALRPIHFSEPRVISPREAARLQGFPDWFRFDPTKWHAFRGIGNSVSPLLSQAILRVIANKVNAAILECDKKVQRLNTSAILSKKK